MSEQFTPLSGAVSTQAKQTSHMSPFGVGHYGIKPNPGGVVAQPVTDAQRHALYNHGDQRSMAPDIAAGMQRDQAAAISAHQVSQPGASLDQMSMYMASLPPLPGGQSYLAHRTLRGRGTSTRLGTMMFNEQGITVVMTNVAQGCATTWPDTFAMFEGTGESKLLTQQDARPQFPGDMSTPTPPPPERTPAPALAAEPETVSILRSKYVADEIARDEREEQLISERGELTVQLEAMNAELQRALEVLGSALTHPDAVSDEVWGLSKTILEQIYSGDVAGAKTTFQALMPPESVKYVGVKYTGPLAEKKATPKPRKPAANKKKK